MADDEKNKVELQPGQVVVDQKTLQAVLEKTAELEKQVADQAAKNAGLEELFASSQPADTTGERKLRERKSFEPAFRTVRVRKYPMGGDFENQGYVIGWTSRGSYQKVDRSGISPVLVDYIDIVFLDHEKNAEGKLTAESVPLLDLLNKGVQVHCKVLELKKNEHKDPTGEEINVTVWDPQHGLLQTGDIIDGYVGMTDLTYTIQIPGRKDPVTIDGQFVN